MANQAKTLLQRLVGEIYYRDFRDSERHPFLLNSAFADAQDALQLDAGGRSADLEGALGDLVAQLVVNDPADCQGKAIDLPGLKAAVAHRPRGARSPEGGRQGHLPHAPG